MSGGAEREKIDRDRTLTIELACEGLWAERYHHAKTTGSGGWLRWDQEDPKTKNGVRREVEAALLAIGAIEPKPVLPDGA